MVEDTTPQDVSATQDGKQVDIPDSVRELVETGPYAHLVTLNEDGSPQVTVVWVGIEGGEFVCGHMFPTQKTDNIRRDPRVALSILGVGMNPIGLRERLVVYGEAHVEDGGAVALLSRLAPSYLGPGVEYPPEQLRSQPGFVTHIRPARISGIGPWSKRMY
jgi:PPOX class probable F420-dependent enzyme